MPRDAGILLLLALLWAVGLSSPAAAEPPPKLSASKIETLKKAGDRLADQGDYQAALEKYTEAYLGVVSRIRGQSFAKPVLPNILNRDELRKEIVKLMKQEYTPEEMLLMDRSYKAFGLVPLDFETEKVITNLFTEEVAGFYDPDSKRMVLIVEDGRKKDPGWLGRLLGARPAFDKDEQKTTLAHELTHALQDQLYDLNALEEGIEEDDDMLLAFAALVEGDATLLMFAEMGTGEDIRQMDPAAMRATFSIMNWLLPLAGGKTYRAAPPIFRESLTFPYFQGMLFVLDVAQQEGWQSVHGAYDSPPVSTEQIMHPRKYTTDVDWPQRVTIPDVSSQLGEDWKHLGGNCLGELQTSIMFNRVAGGRRAAEGWDGDRYDVFQHAAGYLALVSVSIWDSPQDAQEFADAFQLYRKAVPANGAASPSEAAAPDSSPVPNVEPVVEPEQAPPITQLFAEQAERRIEVHEDQVWIVEGFDAQITQSVFERLSETRFEEKRFPLPDDKSKL